MPTHSKQIGSLIASMTLAGLVSAQELSVSPLYSSYAVLQRDADITLNGKAAAGTEVSIEFAGQTISATANESGIWSVTLPAMDAGGPHVLLVTAGDEQIKNHSILIGDVWVCSGQSNMGFRLENSIGGIDATANAANESVHLIQMNRRTSNEPLDEVDSRGWRPDRPDYAGRFSAVGYYFGQSLQSELGVPIGLIESTWGGTPAESWTPEATLRSNPEWAGDLLESIPLYDMTEEEKDKLVAEFETAHGNYIARILDAEQGEDLGWHTPDLDDADWTDYEAPAFWEPTLGSIDGIVWLRHTLTLTADQAAEDATLELGMVDEYDDTWVNGERVGGLTYPSRGAGRKKRSYTVPASVLHEGENVIAIRVVDTRSAGGFGSMAEEMHLETSHNLIPLAGTWKAKVAYDSKAIDGEFPLEGTRMVKAAQQHRRPSSLYNGMIHSMAGLPVRGFIWYQGESNSGRHDQYAKLFPAMISSWRQSWSEHGTAGLHGGEIPFYFVQLPNYRSRSEQPEESDWAELREAQTKAIDLPDVGMAVSIDVGDADDIHPRNKLPVGERLADAVLADVYGHDNPTAHSPTFAGASTGSDGVVTVRLDNAQGLHTADNRAPQSFALSGSDGTFVWADAEIHGQTVTIWSHEVPNPVEVRYAWAWNPDTNLVNGGGKPVAPFRAVLEDGQGK